MNNTTRRFPRTLEEAFKGVDYACPITIGRRSPVWQVIRAVRDFVRWLRSPRAF
jgi:hypothetical protein